jgi:6-phosphofructokinase 2
VAIYPKGGPIGKIMFELLEQEQIDQIPISIEGWTRENFIVVEKETNRQFRFGMPGPKLQEGEWKECLNKVIDPSLNIDFLVASGSMPEGVPVDFYGRLASASKKNNSKLVIDTSGDALKAAVDEGIFLLKPNVNELGELIGRKLSNIYDQEKAAEEVINTKKIEVLIVSLGASGAILASKKEGIIHVSAPSVEKKSAVGAGDSMVAGIIYTISKGKSMLEAIRYGIACGTAATMNSGTELCKLEDVENLYSWIAKAR